MLVERLLHVIGDGRVEIVRQHAVQRIHQRGLHADFAELLGDLRADVPRADHDGRFRAARALLDRHRMVPVLAQQHASRFERLVQPVDRRHHGRGTGGDHQFVVSVFADFPGVHVTGAQHLAGDIHIEHVVAHVHRGAGFGEGLRRRIEHALRVGHVVADPQRDAAGKERQRVVAFEYVDRPVGMLLEDGCGGERSRVSASDDGYGGHGRAPLLGSLRRVNPAGVTPAYRPVPMPG